jgi:Transketolase, C-terminal subunit
MCFECSYNKTLDIETIFEIASKVKGFVTVEDHQIAGGMGSAIAETLMNAELRHQYGLEFVPPIIFIGLQDTFGESGSMKDLLKKYKMDKEAIKEAIRKLL